MNNEPIVIEKKLDAPAGVTWKALTDKDEMKKWYFDIADFEPVKGFEFQFTAVGEDGVTKFVHLCKIMDIIPNKKISYTWRYEGQQGDSLVTFELIDEGNSTTLKLTHEGVETFPADPAYAKKNFVQGWTEIIGTNLPKYLAEQTSGA